MNQSPMQLAARIRLPFGCILSTLFLLHTMARAELLWHGDPDKGRAVFDNLNFEGAVTHSKGKGTILPAKDPVYGKIWRVHKPSEDKRAEIRGAKGWSFHDGKGGTMRQEEPYFIGWRCKIELPGNMASGWVCFQWKSYAAPDKPEEYTQNYPFSLSYVDQNLVLTKYGAGWSTDRSKIVKLWSHPFPLNTWGDVVLVVKPSRDEKVGYLEIYFNGKHQTLLTGGTREYLKTMDGLEVAPKWGVYNRFAIGAEINVSLADLRIGTDFNSVAPKPLPTVTQTSKR
jgi:Polysaccharide lyase